MVVTIIALGVLVGAAVTVLRVALMPAARRELRGRPRLLVVSAAAVAVALALVALAALAGPAAMALLAVIAAGGCFLAWWHARPTSGRRRGLPPGSLSLRGSFQALVDRDYLRRSFDRYGPVFKMSQAHHSVVCVLGLDQGRELLQTYGDRLDRPSKAPDRSAIPRGFIEYMAPADHAVYAPLLRRALSDAVVATACEEAVGRAEEACARLTLEPRVPLPAPSEVIEEYVATTMFRAFFGNLLRPGDRALVEELVTTGRPEPEIVAIERFGRLIRERAKDVGGVTETCYVSELERLSPGAIDDPTVLGNVFHLLESARDSISGAITWATYFLASDPAWLVTVRAEKGRHSGRADPATAAMLETLRLAQSEFVYRRTEQPIEVGGFRIPAGWLLRICIAESHRSEPPFAHPGQFDPGRHLRDHVGNAEFSPFGLDTHACPGARLTLATGRVFVEALSDYAPTLVHNGKPYRGNRHWHHWTVGRDVRVALIPLA